MRSEQDRQLLKSRFADTICVDNFLTADEVQYLIKSFESKDNKVYKNTGPVTSSIKHDDIMSTIVQRLQPFIGEFKVYSADFFNVTFPHIIHNDDQKSLPHTYKAITLPLKLNYRIPTGKMPSLCIFDQYYLEGPAKFFNGDSDIPTYYNSQVYEYSQVQNKTDKAMDPELVKNYLTHLRPHWLEGLSVKSVHTWRPGSAIIFDALKLHCASDFRRLGIESKLGISIFTYTD